MSGVRKGPHKESLGAGLHTKSDPYSLPEGGLLQAAGLHYVRGDDRLYSARESVSLGSVGQIGIRGVHALIFDDADDLLCCRSSGTWEVSPDGETWTTADSDLSPSPASQTSAVHYKNRYFLLDGLKNKEVTKNAIADGAQPHGMEPNATNVTLRVTDATPGWDTPEGTETFYYWSTEVNSETGAESAFTGTIMSVDGANIVGTPGGGVQINLPNFVNDSADIWRIYRSTTNALSGGQSIADVQIAVDGTSPTYIDQGVPNADGQYTDSPAAVVDGITTANATDPTNAYAEGGGAATFTDGQCQGYTNFVALASVADPITRIKVRLYAHGDSQFYADDFYTEYSKFSIHVSPDGGTTWDTPILNTTGNLNNSGTVFFDAFWYYRTNVTIFPFDAPRDWVASEFASGTFQVSLTAHTPGTIYLDHIEVTVSSSGVVDEEDGTPTDGHLYPVITFTDLEGDLYEKQSALPPPVSTCGCSFQDSLLVNDVDDPSVLAYSYSGEPTHFPEAYRININRADTITAMTSTQDMAIIGMERHLVRLNRLPYSTDLRFNPQSVYEVFEEDFGVAGPRAIVQYGATNGPRLWMFYDVEKGICATDGTRAVVLAPHVDWSKLVKKSDAESIVLVPYKPWQAVIMYVPNAPSGSHRIVIHHHEQVRVTGPLSMGSGGSADTKADGEHVSINSSGTVFSENDPLGAYGFWVAQTRPIQPYGDEVSFVTDRLVVRGSGTVDVAEAHVQASTKDLTATGARGIWRGGSIRTMEERPILSGLTGSVALSSITLVVSDPSIEETC